MSEGNVELHRQFNAAFNTHDMGAVIALCDPQIEFHTRFAEVGGVTAYRGHDSLQSFNQGLQEVWGDEVRIEAEEFFDLGERTLTFYVLRGRGQQSRAEVSILATVVARWRAGLCIYWKSYLDRHEALTELGVSEDELEPIEP
jgi:hypothetical protein